MLTTSRCFCSACGTANTTQASVCVSCGSALDPSPVLPPDHMLKEHYRIIAHIGSGGHGEVYKALDTQFADRPVAIKALCKDMLSPVEAAEVSEAFKHEAFLLAKLMHPNLPAIYEYFAEQHSWYLVMSFIEGESLEQHLERMGGSLAVEEALQIGLHLCSVLEYLHNRQPPIIFRDLKPSNVMRTPEGQLYLIDFGIARIFKHGQTRDTTALGSPGYAAPEQYGRAQSTLRNDIYSLGATLYHLLSGRDPSEPPLLFPTLQLPAYPGLAELIARMLEQDAARRPANMAEVRQELQCIASGRPLGLAPREIPRQHPSPIIVPPDHSSPGERYANAGSEYGSMAQQVEGRQRQQQQQQIYYQPSTAPKRGLSRRRVLAVGGAVGLGMLVFGGLLRHQASHTRTTEYPSHLTTMPPVLKDFNGQQIPATALLTVAWSPDGRKLALGGMQPGSLVVCDTDLKRLLAYNGHTGAISSLAWSPDGRTVASASYDTTVQTWNAATGEHHVTYTAHAAPVLSVTWSPDGKIVASSDALHTIHIWNAQTGNTLQILKKHQDQVTAVAWSPDGLLLASASADKTVNVWDVASGNADLTYAGHTDAVQAVAWSPNSRRVASASDDKTVQVWNSLSGTQRLVYSNHRAPVWGVAWSPDGQYISSASWDNTVQTWEAATCTTITTYRENSPVLAVACSAVGSIAYVDAAGDTQIWYPYNN
jgi:eukaryotic-like serine/threonine-protein kinase